MPVGTKPVGSVGIIVVARVVEIEPRPFLGTNVVRGIDVTIRVDAIPEGRIPEVNLRHAEGGVDVVDLHILARFQGMRLRSLYCSGEGDESTPSEDSGIEESVGVGEEATCVSGDGVRFSEAVEIVPQDLKGRSVLVDRYS